MQLQVTPQKTAQMTNLEANKQQKRYRETQLDVSN